MAEIPPFEAKTEDVVKAWSILSEHGDGLRPTDARGYLLVALYLEGDIALQDMIYVLERTDDNMSLAEVGGLLAGGLGVRPQRIETVMQGTPWEVKRHEVAERERQQTFGEWLWHDVARPVGRTLRENWDLAWELGEENQGLTPTGLEWSDLAAKREMNNRIRTQARNELDYLLASEQITKRQHTYWNRQLDIGRNDWRDINDPRGLLEFLDEVWAGMGGEVGLLTFDNIIKQAELRQMIRGTYKLTDTDDSIMADGTALGITEAVAPGDEVYGIVREALGDGTLSEADIEMAQQYMNDNFVLAGVSQGIGQMTNDEIADKLRQMQRAVAISPILSQMGFDGIYDPATGRAWSVTEWVAIQDPKDEVDAVLRAQYIHEYKTNPSVREILNKPFFTGQRTQGARTITPDTELNEKRMRAGLPPVKRVIPQTVGVGPQIPVEDLGIQTPMPTKRIGTDKDGNPVYGYEPWQVPANIVRSGDGFAQWGAFTTRERTMRVKMMHDYGFINDDQYEMMKSGGGPHNMLAARIWEQAVRIGGQFSIDPIAAMGEWAKYEAALKAGAVSRGGYGRVAPKYSVPAELRKIPDYKSLAQETKEVFRGTVGRNMEDWELNLLADALKEYYQTNRDQQITAHRAAWEDAVAGGTMEVEDIEVVNPPGALQYDIEEDYAAELDRYERVEDRANNRNILMQSITKGRRMI